MFHPSTRIHSILDYSFSLFLMLAPAIFGFGEAESETIIPILAGVIICFYSFFTKYEGGLSRVISLKFHYVLDFSIGLLVTISPWLFGFREIVYKPHLLIGIGFTLLAFTGLWPFLRSHIIELHRLLMGRIKFIALTGQRGH